MRVLTLRELNRATLARQLLLRRQRSPVARAVERIAGLQAQWPPAPYVGLWSRLDGFRRTALERAVLSGDVVKATLMRSTLHLVSRRDYGLYWAALHDIPTWSNAAVADAERVYPELAALAADGAVTLKTVVTHLCEHHGWDELHARRVWHAARVRAHIHHAPETALWQTRPQAVYARLERPPALDRAEAIAVVVRRYLAAFGPATRADIAEWSGLRVRDFEPALTALEPLRRFVSEDGKELLDLPRAPLPAAETAGPVRFLPKWDNVLLAHTDRRRVLADEHRKTISIKNGDVQQTVLVDGIVAAIWTVERGRVYVEPIAPIARRFRRELEQERAQLEAWLR
jgi:Winged helix DNA-binding domain